MNTITVEAGKNTAQAVFDERRRTWWYPVLAGNTRMLDRVKSDALRMPNHTWLTVQGLPQRGELEGEYLFGVRLLVRDCMPDGFLAFVIESGEIGTVLNIGEKP